MVGPYMFYDTGERTTVRFELLPAKRIVDPFYLVL